MTDRASVAQLRRVLERMDHPDPGGAAYPEGGMEHRLGTRMPVSLPVKLQHAAGTAAFGRMLNVSLSGAYVRTSVKLDPLASVGIACEGAFSGAVSAPCITAFVTRVAADGVALEWFEFAPAVIRQLMRREQPQAKVRTVTSTAAMRTSVGIVTDSPASPDISRCQSGVVLQDRAAVPASA